jgi:BNR repeat-like domain
MMDAATLKLKNQENVTIYRHENRFAAWPFNLGVFKYAGDEIIVGFVSKYCEYKEAYQVDHGYEPPEEPSQTLYARSLDGGLHWDPDRIRELKEIDNLDWRIRHDKGGLPKPKPVDFADPNLMILHSMVHRGNGGVGYCLISTDKGNSFQGPFTMPWCRYEYVWGRPDYVIREDGACVLLTTVFHEKEAVARPASFISKNGGASWVFLSHIAPPESEFMRIMPSGILLENGEIVVSCRCQIGPTTNMWAECYASRDGGRTWSFRSRLNDHGSPCHLLLLDGGRILATYGYRVSPFGIRAAISEDGGQTWGREIVIRNDGGSWDLGYPKSVQLDNGEIVSAYYFNDADDSVDISGGIRYIACTRWSLEDIA